MIAVLQVLTKWHTPLSKRPIAFCHTLAPLLAATRPVMGKGYHYEFLGPAIIEADVADQFVKDTETGELFSIYIVSRL